MNKLKLKPALPRKVQIIEKSPYEVAQSYQDKCQPLRTHLLAKMQSSYNQIQPSQIRFIAKKVDENDLLNKIQLNEKKENQSENIHSQMEQSTNKQQNGNEVKQDLIERSKQNEQIQQNSNIQNGMQNKNQSDDPSSNQKFRKLSTSLHENSQAKVDNVGKQVKNIFETAKIYQNYSKDETLGPQYTKEGKIIPYSIVGKPQWYVKELTKEIQKHKTSQNSDCSDQTQKLNNNILNDLIKTKNDEIRKRGNSYAPISLNEDADAKEKMSKTQIYPKLWHQQEDKTFVSDIKFMKRKKRDELMNQKDNDGNEFYYEKEMTQEQVIQKIQEEEERLKLNQSRIQENNKCILKSLTIEEQQQLLKEQKILEKFENNERKFDELIFKQSMYIQRDPQRSILLSQEQHRKKIETINAFEILKPIDQKYGDSYWYRTLRSYNCEPSEQNSKRPEWNPNDKNERIKEEHLEIIHKKRALSAAVRSQQKNTLNGTFLSFKSGHYAQQKLDQTQNQWNYEQVKHIQEDNYEQQKSIEAIGVNKFNLEKDSILSYQNQQRLAQLTNQAQNQENSNNQSQQIQNSQTFDRYNLYKRGNSSFVSGGRSRINSESEGFNGQITYKTKFLKKYTLNDEYKNGKFQSNGSLIFGYPRQEQQQSPNGSFIQINQQFLDQLKDENQQSEFLFEEQNIMSEEVLHAQWQDRQTLAKTGKFVFKKVQLKN
ncbi:hypothetical protein TTHERM_00216090 (macronuclear) [Tetrahymena thermophila SB210]|uniref:Uncharacterized protein n=1 Tax=Tetrahymena thermophila (strain SB210) TaxID=312017 RepID=I7LVW5_TETTS|nr:hypothetical protein TTHERM_00216090 [Tetrahymena thermophila SB210]EAS00234.2 hypothetical protein TTHERM_00216090 [Tetrahymena thermophila SB210]|eukprot:XP_001020479.2 hypothetical protein TTHERM_00216090 [Tetrahymena thermophila SB210]